MIEPEEIIALCEWAFFAGLFMTISAIALVHGFSMLSRLFKK